MTNSLDININSNIAEINLNRPNNANALDEELWISLGDCFSKLDENENVRVCILSGFGKHFSAGIDLDFFMQIISKVESFKCEGRKREYLRNKIIRLQEAFTQIEKCRKPVIASIHGACIGGGLDLINACDMRYSMVDAVFQIKEIDFGLVADVGTLQRMPQLIPQGIMRELAYTGRTFSGEEAFKLGLVNNCFADQKEMTNYVSEVANKIASKSPLAIRGIKEMLLYTRENTVSESLKYVATWNSAMLLSSDFKESINAMQQNRLPEFKN